MNQENRSIRIISGGFETHYPPGTKLTDTIASEGVYVQVGPYAWASPEDAEDCTYSEEYADRKSLMLNGEPLPLVDIQTFANAVANRAEELGLQMNEIHHYADAS